jgi:hypothetical protein
MTKYQRAFLIFSLHGLPASKQEEKLNKEIQYFGLSESEKIAEKELILNNFNLGIKNLNVKQLENVIRLANSSNFKNEDLIEKLTFFEVNSKFHSNIQHFLEDYLQANAAIDVSELDNEFFGVQVATRDNFNTLLNQGYTGDWELQPANIDPLRIQIASMNEKGNFPRGYYINADIIDVQPVSYGVKILYRIYFTNPILINSGNRNVKFTRQPVKYIRPIH